MEIIIHGGDEKYIHRFTCNKCGCVFDQDEDEFMLSFYLKRMAYQNVILTKNIFAFCPKDCGGYGIMETSPEIVLNRLIEYKERFYYKHSRCDHMLPISQVKNSQTYMCGFIGVGTGYTIKCPIHGEVQFYNMYYRVGKRFMD
jgi:hypothetical protein